MFLVRMKAIQLFSPAKVNLYLRVLGRRPDGFHDLLSLVCPLDFGDRMGLELHGNEGHDVLKCDEPNLPTDGTNLIIQAIDLFRLRHPFTAQVRVQLDKKIPMGAGLGGGSSNAAATLWGLNELVGKPFQIEQLMEMAAELGSDCPLFLQGGAAIMRGRGERIEPLDRKTAALLEGRKLLLVMSGIHISTPWAYGALSARDGLAVSSKEAELGLAAFCAGRKTLEQVLHNDFEQVAYEKYVALPAARAELAASGIGPVLLSGSGSAMFALLSDSGKEGASNSTIRGLRQAFREEFGLVNTTLTPFFPAPFKLREGVN